MKVKVLQEFIDKHSGKHHKEGATLVVSKERYNEILEAGPFVEEIKGAKSPDAAK